MKHSAECQNTMVGIYKNEIQKLNLKFYKKIILIKKSEIRKLNKKIKKF